MPRSRTDHACFCGDKYSPAALTTRETAIVLMPMSAATEMDGYFMNLIPSVCGSYPLTLLYERTYFCSCARQIASNLPYGGADTIPQVPPSWQKKNERTALARCSEW